MICLFVDGESAEKLSDVVAGVRASSCELHLDSLCDGSPDTFWQSSGLDGQHWIMLEMEPDRIITSLSLEVILYCFQQFDIMKSMLIALD